MESVREFRNGLNRNLTSYPAIISLEIRSQFSQRVLGIYNIGKNKCRPTEIIRNHTYAFPFLNGKLVTARLTLSTTNNAMPNRTEQIIFRFDFFLICSQKR